MLLATTSSHVGAQNYMSRLQQQNGIAQEIALKGSKLSWGPRETQLLTRGSQK